jgi:nucleoid-associated protein YejK
MEKPNNRYSQMEERERRLEAEPVDSLEEKRAKGIQEIFDFYTRQQLMVGKKATFEQIEHELSNLNMGEFMRFCKDFKIPVSKTKCAEVFKK